MVQRARDQPGDGAGKGAGRADRAIRGLAIRDGRVALQCSRPHRVRSESADPKAVMLPLPVAVVVVMFVTAWVVTVGASSVVKVTSSP